MATYKAKSGETFKSIAAKFRIKEEELKAANIGNNGSKSDMVLTFENRFPAYRIFEGDVLIIPSGKSVDAKISHEEQVNQNGNSVRRAFVDKRQLEQVQSTVSAVKTTTDLIDANLKGLEKLAGNTRFYWGLLHDKSVSRNMFLSGIDPKVMPPQFDPGKALSVKLYPEKPSGSGFTKNQYRTTSSTAGAIGAAGKAVGVVGDGADAVELAALMAAGDTKGAKVKASSVAMSKVGASQSLVIAGKVCRPKSVLGTAVCVGTMAWIGNYAGGYYGERLGEAMNTLDEITTSKDLDPDGLRNID